MDIGKTVYFSDRQEWRRWLEANFAKEKEVWLVFPARGTGKRRIAYNDAVEEALSFGWIDSNVKRIDEDASAQRFTPRKPNSRYSQANKERLRWLLQEGRIHPSIRESAKQVLSQEFVFPLDILAEIREDSKAWENYQRFSPAYRRIRIAYIEAARNRPEEFKKRLGSFIRSARQNRLIGFGGIEKYY